MKKKLYHILLSVLLILVVCIICVTQAQAAVNYSNGNGTFSLSFDSPDDINPCQDSNYWLINLGYNDLSTQVQGGTHPIGTTSVTDSFTISNGTSIQLIEIWGGATAEEASQKTCYFVIQNSSEGVFTWEATSGPVISNITVSSISSTSVTITWTTDVSSTSVINYGTTTSYGSSQSDSGSTTSHSISLTSLSASTTYHYKVSSVGSGGTTDSSDNTFATPATGTTTTNTTTSTVTATPTTTPAPTATPVPDRTAPSVTLDTDLSKPFGVSSQIAGKASDPSGIEKVEYSIDDGNNWSPVDKIPTLGATSVAFTFTPPILEDDNYKIRVRAQDGSPTQNIGVSDAYTLILDRLPPKIAGTIIAIGPQILSPNAQGYLLTSKGVKQKITLSAVGGPIRIEISAIPTETDEQTKVYKLTRNPDNGLWSANITFDKPGIYQLFGKSIDGAGNATEQTLNMIAVLDAGKIIRADQSGSKTIPVDNATVQLYYFEEKYQTWRLWDGPSYNQANPAKTNAQGEFSYLVPSGKYYFDIQANGFTHTVSAIFQVNGPTILNPTFALKPLKLLFEFWIFHLYLPDFSTMTVPVSLSLLTLPDTTTELIEAEAPAIQLPTTDGNKFDLFATRGTPVVVTFMNLWSPEVQEQTKALDQLNSNNFKAYTVILGDNISKTAIFKKTGAYRTSFIVDKDATLVTPYALDLLPTHYFLDAHGIIKKIVTGILNEQEMEAIMAGIQ